MRDQIERMYYRIVDPPTDTLPRTQIQEPPIITDPAQKGSDKG